MRILYQVTFKIATATDEMIHPSTSDHGGASQQLTSTLRQLTNHDGLCDTDRNGRYEV